LDHSGFSRNADHPSALSGAPFEHFIHRRATSANWNAEKSVQGGHKLTRRFDRACLFRVDFVEKLLRVSILAIA
jgi:hypothetical protein